MSSEEKVNENQEHQVSEKKKGMALIVYDFQQKPLIPIKILSFVTAAGNIISYCFH